MNKTSIEWTHRPGTVGMTWNPIHFRRFKHSDEPSWPTGNMCTRISPGCTHCYASTLNERWGNRLEYIVENLSTGEFYLDEKELQAPLRTKKPCTIFVGDMFDLFHEAIPLEMIIAVFGVAWQCPWHTLQFLTKRADRMLAVLTGLTMDHERMARFAGQWPLPNVWLGVSVESQKYADERIPLLLQTPAAVRFLSVEPQLEEVSVTDVLVKRNPRNWAGGEKYRDAIDWVIVGGESGPKARPFNLAWAESLREQCKAAGAAFFMKQIGSKPQHADGAWYDYLKDRKGGDPFEWPESLRVREFPGTCAKL